MASFDGPILTVEKEEVIGHENKDANSINICK